MRLSDRSGANGLIPEFLIDLVNLFPRLLLNNGTGKGRIQFLYVLAEFLQLLAVAFREQVHTA